MDIDGYAVTDTFFGAPYIDVDEERTVPTPHRYVHGGFNETATRFSFYFPPADVYEGRFIQPLEGGLGGSENNFGGPMGSLLGGFDVAIGLGAYMVESNQGHIGSELCSKAGDDATVYAYRASAESGRFSRHIAAQIYGAPPHHGYVFGGSGGANRSAMCIEHVHDVWDGAMPFMGASAAPVRGAGGGGAAFATMFNAQRVLGAELDRVVDALEPGGSGDSLESLSIRQRQALYDLYRSGFPRGVEYMIALPMGQIGLWAWTADQWYADDADYYDHSFWSSPGYAGHDEPQALEADLIVDAPARVRRIRTAGELLAAAQVPGSAESTSPWARLALRGPDLRFGVDLDLEGGAHGYLQGASVRIVSGKAAGRQLYCVGLAGESLLLDGTGEAGNLRLTDVEVGDEVVVDNRRYLAYCYRYRHVVNVDDPAQAHLVIDGRPLYPQRPPQANALSPHMGVFDWAGRFTGKVLTLQHTHDSSIWPRPHVFPGAEDRWILRWTENAEHIPAVALPSVGSVAPTSRLIEYQGTVEQSLHDLVAWVEDGVVPAGTNATLEAGGPLVLGATASERGGIQPVVTLTVNGSARAKVAAGEEVTYVVEAEVPPGAGTIISVVWDFDGAGTWSESDAAIDGNQSRVRSVTSHAHAEPGVYFPSVRVTSHRDGDVSATGRRVMNVGRARVVVE